MLHIPWGILKEAKKRLKSQEGPTGPYRHGAGGRA